MEGKAQRTFNERKKKIEEEKIYLKGRYT